LCIHQHSGEANDVVKEEEGGEEGGEEEEEEEEEEEGEEEEEEDDGYLTRALNGIARGDVEEDGWMDGVLRHFNPGGLY
jgi:hypothetical protein